MNETDGKMALVLEKGAVADAEVCSFASDRPPRPLASTGVRVQDIGNRKVQDIGKGRFRT